MGAVGKSDYQTWLTSTAKDLAGDGSPDSTFSMGDIEGIAMSYALTHGMNDDKIIDDLRNEIDKLNQIPQNVKAPMPSGQLWSNDDLDDALQFMKNNPQYINKLLSGINASDRSAVQSVISFGWADGFDSYDSDVAEQFIDQYENMFK